MKKSLPFLVLLFLFGLTACGAVTPTAAAVSTPNLATPAEVEILPVNGSATLRGSLGVEGVFLFAQPQPEAEKLGEMRPGETAQVQGQDASGEWLYLSFDGINAWAPAYFFEMRLDR